MPPKTKPRKKAKARARASKPTTAPTASTDPAQFDPDQRPAKRLHEAPANVFDESNGTLEAFLRKPLLPRLRLAVAVFPDFLNTVYRLMEAHWSLQCEYWQESREDAIKTGFVIGEDDPRTYIRDGKGGLRLMLRRKPDGTLEPSNVLMGGPALGRADARLRKVCLFIAATVREAKKLYPDLIERDSALARVYDDEKGLETICVLQVPEEGDDQYAGCSLPQRYLIRMSRYWVELKPELIELAAVIERRERDAGRGSAAAQVGGRLSVEHDDAPPALTERQADVLRTMARFDGSCLLSARAIVDEMDATKRLSEETVRQCVVKLIEADLAERPKGPRSGARLINKGRRLAGKIAD